MTRARAYISQKSFPWSFLQSMHIRFSDSEQWCSPAKPPRSQNYVSTLVCRVTAWLGVPPWWRTTSNASARLMQAKRPVKATVLLSAELSNSITGVTAIIALRKERLTYRFAFFLAGRRARVLGAGALFSASTLARRASIRLTTRGGVNSRAGSLFSPTWFFFKHFFIRFFYASSQ